jgi:hypothetical protein
MNKIAFPLKTGMNDTKVRGHREKSMRVTGTVRDSASLPLAGCGVVAYHGDVNLKKAKSLATGRTDKDGTYALSIDLAHYPLGVNLRLAVLNITGSTEVWSAITSTPKSIW